MDSGIKLQDDQVTNHCNQAKKKKKKKKILQKLCSPLGGTQTWECVEGCSLLTRVLQVAVSTWASQVPQWVKKPLQCRRLWFDPWRRKWQPSPVFSPRESHGQWSLVGYSPWAYKESDMTKAADACTRLDPQGHCCWLISSLSLHSYPYQLFWEVNT